MSGEPKDLNQKSCTLLSHTTFMRVLTRVDPWRRPKLPARVFQQEGVLADRSDKEHGVAAGEGGALQAMHLQRMMLASLLRRP
jgi:hypothetical protein